MMIRPPLPYLVSMLCLGLLLGACDDSAVGGGNDALDAGPGRDAVPGVRLDAQPDEGGGDADPVDVLPDVPDATTPDMAALDMAALDMAALDMALELDLALPDMARVPDMAPDLALLADMLPVDLGPDMSPDAGPPANCGDGVLDDDEACDDGNLDAGDGCDALCAVEAGWRCDAPELEPIVVEVDGLADCEDDPVRPALGPWPAWRAVYVGGAVLYSARENPWSHRFDVRIERGGRDQIPLQLMVGEGRYASAEEAEDAGRGRATDAFHVGHRDAIAVWFPDAECAGNEGRLTVRFEALSACRPEGPELCENGLDDDLDGQIDCQQDACRAVCADRFCGDGILDPGEGCDDGARDEGDGCSADCLVEPDYACGPPADVPAVPAAIDAFDHCVPGGPAGVPVDLAPGGWRAYYVGGAALFSINAEPWAAKFVVRIERADGVQDLAVGEGRFPSAEAASAAIAGRFTAPFAVDPEDAVSAYFPDDNCNRNEGTLDIEFRPVSRCAPADGIR